MAQGLRTQVAAPAAWIAWFALATACADPKPDETAQPTTVDLAGIADDALIDRILDECHGPLRGQLDAIAVAVTLPDGQQMQAYARLPEAIRTASPDGLFVLRGDVASRLGDDPRAATTAETERLQALRELLDAATFGPLARAAVWRRVDTDTLEFGDDVRVRLRPDTLLPAALIVPRGTITFDDYLRTPVAWLPRRLTHPLLGSCEITFEKSDMKWAEGFFAAAPNETPAATTTAPKRIQLAPDGAEARSAVPRIESSDAIRWLVLDDPGSWPERAAAYKPCHDALLDQGQKIAGFPILTRMKDRDVLVIPFRPRQGDALPPLASDHEVIRVAAGRELVVHPPQGDLATRRAGGERLLRAALESNGLQAEGAIRYQPYFHLDEAPPTAAELASPIVRVSVRLR